MSQKTFFFVKKMADKSKDAKVKDANPFKKGKIHEICACLHNCIFCLQYSVVLKKSPKNLSGIVYQIDHIW